MGQAMKEAFEKSVKEATDFAHNHPVYFTLIALGILVILTPWAIEALGFGELGPIEGELAHGFLNAEQRKGVSSDVTLLLIMYRDFCVVVAG